MVTVNSVAIPTVNNTAVVGTGTGFTTLAYNAASGTSNLVTRDSSGNSYFNSSISGYATTATAAGTTTLTVASAQQQYFTGSTTQTVTMPVTSTLVLGQTFKIVNNSSGVVTVQSSGGNTIQAMTANTQLVLTVISLVSTAAAGWNAIYSPFDSSGSSIPSTATSNQILQSVASSAPVWSTATYPATTTANRLLYSSAANVVGQITTANNSVLVTNGSGVPSISNLLPSGVAVNGTNSGTNVTLGITNNATTSNSNARLFISSGQTAGSASVSSYMQLTATNSAQGPTTYSLVSESVGQLFTIMSGIPTVSPVPLLTVDLSGNSILTGNSTVKGTVSTGLAGGTNGQVILVGSTSGTATVRVSSTAGASNFTLPTSEGTAGQALLSDGGAGTGYTFGTVMTVVDPTSSSSASIEWTDLTENSYFLVISNCYPDTNGAQLFLRVSQDNGATYFASGYQAGVNYNTWNSTTIVNSSPATAFPITGPMLDNNGATTFGVCGAEVYINNLNGSLNNTTVSGTSSWTDTSGAAIRFGTLGGQQSDAFGNALRILFSTGNIGAGQFTLYKIG